MALQDAQDQDGKEPWSELPNHAAQQMVDSILASPWPGEHINGILTIMEKHIHKREDV